MDTTIPPLERIPSGVPVVAFPAPGPPEAPAAAAPPSTPAAPPAAAAAAEPPMPASAEAQEVLHLQQQVEVLLRLVQGKASAPAAADAGAARADHEAALLLNAKHASQANGELAKHNARITLEMRELRRATELVIHENRVLEAAVSAANAQAADAAEEVDQARDEYARLFQAERGRLSAELRQTRRRLNAVMQTDAAKNRELEHARLQMKEMEAIIEALAAEATEAEAARAAETAEAAGLHDEIEALRETVQSVETNLDSLLRIEAPAMPSPTSRDVAVVHHQKSPPAAAPSRLGRGDRGAGFSFAAALGPDGPDAQLGGYRRSKSAGDRGSPASPDSSGSGGGGSSTASDDGEIFVRSLSREKAVDAARVSLSGREVAQQTMY